MKLITNNPKYLSILLLSLCCSSAQCMKITDVDSSSKTKSSLIPQMNSLSSIIKRGDSYLYGTSLYGKDVKQDWKEALRWYGIAVTEGHEGAKYKLDHALIELGDAYYNGGSLVKKDSKEAVKYYKIAKELGQKGAQDRLTRTLYEIGFQYYHGGIVEKNYTKAIKYYKLAAEQGSMLAHTDLGDMYFNGMGIEKNYDEALKWYGPAAEQGHVDAKHGLIKIMNERGNKYCDENDFKNAAFLFFESSKILFSFSNIKPISNQPLRTVPIERLFSLVSTKGRRTDEQVKIVEIKEDLESLKKWLSDRSEYYMLQSGSSIGGFKDTFGENPYLKILSDRIASSCKSYLNLVSEMEMEKEEPRLFISCIYCKSAPSKPSCKPDFSQLHSLLELSVNIDGEAYFSFTSLKLDMMKTDALHKDLKQLNAVYHSIDRFLEETSKEILEQKLSVNESKIFLKGSLFGYRSLNKDCYDFLNAVLEPYLQGKWSITETHNLLKTRMKDVSEDLDFSASLNHHIVRLIKMTANERNLLFARKILGLDLRRVYGPDL